MADKAEVLLVGSEEAGHRRWAEGSASTVHVVADAKDADALLAEVGARACAPSR